MSEEYLVSGVDKFTDITRAVHIYIHILLNFVLVVHSCLGKTGFCYLKMFQKLKRLVAYSVVTILRFLQDSAR